MAISYEPVELRRYLVVLPLVEGDGAVVGRVGEVLRGHQTFGHTAHLTGLPGVTCVVVRGLWSGVGLSFT